MNTKSVLQIIKEEISNFYSDWQMSDEPSVTDTYYEKNLGIDSKKSEIKINAEVIGYANKQWDKPINPPVPIYKNPMSLEGFGREARGIIFNNGDFYLAQTTQPAHETILKLLSELGVVSYATTFNYFSEYPEEFIAVMRAFDSNTFTQSTAYDDFPIYYQAIFDMANEKYPFKFHNMEMSEQLDPNNMISYHPDGYDAGIVNEKT
jgi:hypothetical protein